MSQAKSATDAVLAAAKRLARAASKLTFANAPPWIYNPLQYAWPVHQQYIERYAQASCQVLFLGMNPGPWGMSQTGVPFGEISAVRDWLKLSGRIGRPHPEHPRRPVAGFECTRQEVSGTRFWGLFKNRFDSPQQFFGRHFVASYCPLAFMHDSGLNVTPDKLTAPDRAALQAICDRHLAELLCALQPNWLVAVGGWAEKRALQVVADQDLGSSITVGKILHPSPASPAANRDWAQVVTRQLIDLGVWS